MRLSVVIPARNEADNLPTTLNTLTQVLSREKIPHEIVVVDDHSTDQTVACVKERSLAHPTIRLVSNSGPGGFGRAVRCGLDQADGDAMAVFMADCSDDPEDLVRFYRAMVEQKVDCVFGSRFMPGGRTVDYPWPKWVLNRLGNKMIQVLFRLPFNDVTNAFKLFRRETIGGLQPLLSYHFNLTVELPLKAIIRGYSYVVLPNSWTNRRHGESKLRIKEMGSRYMFIMLYCLIEKWLSRGDYAARKNP